MTYIEAQKQIAEIQILKTAFNPRRYPEGQQVLGFATPQAYKTWWNKIDELQEELETNYRFPKQNPPSAEDLQDLQNYRREIDKASFDRISLAKKYI
jgi:hypothetical protein